MKKLFGFMVIYVLLGVSAWCAQPFSLAEPGENWLVDYSKYGVFKGLGTNHYSYQITKREALAAAVGEGIYPNRTGLFKDQAFLAQRKQIDFAKEDKGFFAGEASQAQINFYRWAGSSQPEGVKLFFVGESFKDAQMWVPALKAFYALLVHFPSTTRQSPDGNWGQALADMAIQEIRFILRNNPQLGLDFVDAEIDIRNPGMLDEKILRMNPGRFVRRAYWGPVALNPTDIVYRSGNGKVQVVKYRNGHWQLLVDGHPYMIKGLVYDMTKIGFSPDLQNMQPWELSDDPEFFLKSWTDFNGNYQKDAGEDVNDLKLLKDMGVNTVRIYFGASNKQGLRNLYQRAGIRFIMGTAFGAYGLDSGGGWANGTDYSDPKQQEKMLQAIRDLVQQHKDEPYTLMWCLGNENNYGVANNSNRYPAIFAHFLQKAVTLIHQLDPNHPVAYCNGDLGSLEKYVSFAPDLDIFGVNAYRGKQGFGNLWEKVAKVYDKPVMITEFGCPAYSNFKKGEDQDFQAEYLSNNWKDIAFNAGGGPGVGNALGGVVFEWADEWWKAGSTKSPTVHDTSQGQWQGPFADGWAHEEWFGITGQGNGNDSPHMRELRKAYYAFQKLWRQ